jgi:hypothetical protein
VPNKIVEQLLRATPSGEPTVELSGYIGYATPESVRLYKDLSLSSYFEIPRADILYSSQEGDPKTSPVRVFVRSSATILLGTRLKASTASALNSSKASRLKAPVGPLGLRERGADGIPKPPEFREAGSLECALLLIACAEGNVGACYLYVMYCSIYLPPISCADGSC